ncbi:MAG: monovalent cation/H(+) antiporter subunit G, partial [Candidatus Omnitrophica bacterium]|nr:monovalent cation/H(+) antiporter subunit G [Candidatus Omnitrophota bacterium]
MIETFGTLFLCIGLFFVFSGSLGVTRFEDVYLRLQA